MSIKDLFEKKKTKPVVRKSKAEIATSAESIETAGQKSKKEGVYLPQLDFSKPANFAFYGSAEKYYSDAFKTIVGTYPYDCSEEEILQFRNEINYVERYIFDNLYPKTNGFARFSADGWGSAGTPSGEYGVPASKEYIYVYGGPLSASSGMTQHKLKYSFSASNLYQQDIYDVIDENPAGRVGTRESNLKYDLDRGSTVEFWLQKDAFDISKTKKEVVFDLWNQAAYTDSGYGRLLVELSGNNDYTDGSPFFISVNSGSTGFSNTKIGTSVTTASLANWHHYAFSFINDRNSDKIKVKFYIDGALNDEKTLGAAINEVTGGMRAFVGALQAAVMGGTGTEGAGKLSGSIDELRYWKSRKTSEEIGYNYFRPVRGGTNKKVSNATLGLYYKFNEGIVGSSSIDSTVLDYSGRISNGQWVGYDSDSRATGSAIVLAGAYASEEKDPIIYSAHPEVSSLRSQLEFTGSSHDQDNTNRMLEMFPSWMKDKARETADPSLDNMTQLMGVQFDKTFLLINRITELKKQNYFDDNEKAFPFIKQMIESYGLTTEDLLTAAEINEKVLNKNDTQNLENDIQDVKNKLYQNLFNNLFQIYKLKGTEKSFRNIFRCLGLDDELIAIKIYADNTTYTLDDNYKNKLLRAVHVDHNKVNNFGATIHQWYTSSNPNSISFISGSGLKGFEDNLGFTAECKFLLPDKPHEKDPHFFRTPFVTSSIFGMNSADGTDQTDLSYPTNNYANFRVLVERDAVDGTNAKFRLSSVSPTPFPELTTSFYNDIYSNSQWTIGVSVKPTNELGNLVPGSNYVHDTSSSPDYNYLVEFYGVNMLGERVLNEFLLTSSIANTVALNMLRDPKRLYMGAQYTNTTGTLVNRTDIKFDSLKYYNLHNDTASIKQHMIDQESYGRRDSLEQINLYAASGTSNIYIPKFKTLILNWNFRNLSSSKADGTFFVDDFSSGSAADETYGKYKGYFNKQHTGIGRFYLTSSTAVFDKVYVNSMQKQTPETTMASNMINILQRDDDKFTRDDKAVRYSVHFEKSPYEAINKEVLNMFSTILDFNDVLGSSAERYRQEYKSLENLRRLMFARFENEVSVEKFISYYRWFDHAVGRILEEFIPGSVKYEASLATLIQSHILERNKYWTKFPTMEFKGTDPEAGMAGYEELNYNWKFGHAPTHNKQAYNSKWWHERASRERGLLSSSAEGANVDREKIRMEIESFRSASALFLAQSSSLPAGYIPKYRGKETALRRFTKPYKFSMDVRNVIHGGVNFNRNKDFSFTFNALYPAGPVYTPGGATIPQNILLAFESEAYDKKDIKDVFDPNKKEKVFGKVIHGRHHDDGTGYSNTDMNHAFPFNVYRSSVSGGYGDLVNDGYATGTIITNLHSDTYGPDLEVPMQGPFTERWVGGLQARHIDINRSSSFGNFKRLDDYATRPEAWRILLDRCPNHQSGAIGMVGADYPFPNSIADLEALKHSDRSVYPMTSSRKANLYRDEYAKRPVNIKNIRTITGAISHGNYRHNYEVVHSVGSNQNPRAFLRDTPVLPFQISPGRNAVTMFALGGTTNASDGNTVRLSDGVVTKILTFKTTPVSPDHVLIGSNYSNTFYNLVSNINLSHSWGLRAYTNNFGSGIPAYVINVNYQGEFTNMTVATTWATLKVSEMSGSPNIAKSTDITNVLTIRNVYRGQYGHMYTTGATRYENPIINDGIEEHFARPMYDYDYSVGYLTGSGDYANKTVIKSRFAAPGGIETDTAGYRDFRGDEYSAYTPIPYRNLRVRRPDQATHDIVPDITGSSALEQGGPGIRVFDQMGRDIGIRSNLARHTARFGRDSLVFPPTQYRQEYSLTRSFIGYGGEAIYRGNRALQGWWRLDNYLMAGGLTGNIDSSGYNRSYDFDSGAPPPSASLFIDNSLFSADKSLASHTGPSYYVQTASFAAYPSLGAPIAYPIGPAATWEAIIGNQGSKKFTLAAWLFRPTDDLGVTTYPRIFDFGNGSNHGGISLWHDQSTGKERLVLRYYSKAGSGGIEDRRAATATGSMFTSETGNSKGEWVHVAVSADLAGTNLLATETTRQNGVDGTRVKFYINGQIVETFAADTGSADSDGLFHGISGDPCYVGNRYENYDRSWVGQIADAAVWNDTLPEEDIVAIYNAAKKPVRETQKISYSGSFYTRRYGVGSPKLQLRGPGHSNCEVPSIHKVHRNSLNRVYQTTDRTVLNRHKMSAWWPDVYEYENAGSAGTSDNSSSINYPQWSVTNDETRKMIFSFWIKDEVRTAFTDERNIFSLNTSLTGTFPDNHGAKQIFSVQLEDAAKDTRRLAVRFGDGTSNSANTTRRVWFTENEVITASQWTHVLVATDGYVSGATLGAAGVDNFNWQENPLCGVCIWVNGRRQILRRNNHGGNVYGIMNGEISTAGGGYFSIGGGCYAYRQGDSWQYKANNYYIDEFAMWQGTSTGSLVSSSIPSEIYNSGEYHNLRRTSLGEPYLYYRFGDDPADPQTGSMTSQDIIHDQSTNKRHASVTIDGRTAGRMIMISASAPGTTGSIGFTSTTTERWVTRKEYDNYYIQHPIPRSDAQYAWITAAFGGTPSSSIKVGYAPFDTWDDGLDNSGNNPYSDLLTASLIGEYYDSNNRILAHYTNVYSNKSNAPAQIKAVQNFGITITPTRRPDRPMYSGTKTWKKIPTTYYRDVSGQLLSINTVGPGRSLKEMNAYGDLEPSEHAQEVLLPFATTSSLSHEPGRGWVPNTPNFLHGREEGAINPHELTFRTGPSASVMRNPVEDRFNLYLTRLNGPYGATNFNFIRNQDNPNLQASRQFNFYTTIKSPSDSLEGSGSIFSRRSDKIRWFNRVSPVTSKYKPLIYGFGVTRTFKNKFNEDVEVEGTSYFKSTFANQKGYFNNEKLNEFLGLDKKENLTFYDKFKNLYLDGGLESELSPIERMQFVTYREQVYPSSLNMYSRFVRSRVNFDMENWRNNYVDRISRVRWQYQARPYKQFATEHYSELQIYPVSNFATTSVSKISAFSSSEVRTSKWPMDAAGQYISKSVGTNMAFQNHRCAFSSAAGLTSSYGFKSKIMEAPAGRLLNNYTHWHGATMTNADIAYWNDTYRVENGATERSILWSQYQQDLLPYYFSREFITASCLYALKNVSFHSHSVYAWNRPNVCLYRTNASNTSESSPAKMPNIYGDTVEGVYTTHRARRFIGYGDGPFIVGETAGRLELNTGSSELEFVSASVQPFYDDYEDFSLDIRTKNKDMSVLPEFRISNHVEVLANSSEIMDQTLPNMFEIPGAHNTETMPDGTELNSLSTSGSFFKIYSNSDFLEHFEILNEDHRDLMDPTTLTLRCTAIKKFMPYKGFYPAERTVQMYDQFMKSYAGTITSSADTIHPGGFGTTADGENPYGALARPVITPFFAPGILFNSIKSGIGVDFPVITTAGDRGVGVGPSGKTQYYKWGFGTQRVTAIDGTGSTGYRNQQRFQHTASLGPYATQNSNLRSYRITASLAVGPRYSDASGNIDGFTQLASGNGKFTLVDRYMQIVGSNRPGTLKWSKRVPFEAIIRPENYLKNTMLTDMFVNDHTTQLSTSKYFRWNSDTITGSIFGSSFGEPSDAIYTLMADNFIGAVPDFYLAEGELSTLTSKKESKLDLYIESGSCYAMRLKMRRSMNQARNWDQDLLRIFHKTSSTGFYRRAGAAGEPERLRYGAHSNKDFINAVEVYKTERDQPRQIKDYEIFQDPIRQRNLFETLTMYNRPGAFGPPVTGRDLNFTSWAQSFKVGSDSVPFSTWTSSYGTNAVLDSSNGFNPAFTPPYYDGHAVIDFVFKATESKKYTIAEIMQKSRTHSWRFDPGWLVRRAYRPKISNRAALSQTGSFTLIPGEIYYLKDGSGNVGGVTGTIGPGHGMLSGGANPLETSIYSTEYVNSTKYGGAPYCGNHINETSMQLDSCVNIKLIGTIPSTTTDNEGNLTFRSAPTEDDKVWIIQPKWETPVLNFKDARPYPQLSISSSTTGITPNNNPAMAVAATGMWHQYGRLPEKDEGIYLELEDIPENWLNGHWSIKKNLNPGHEALAQDGVSAEVLNAAPGYNSAYTASAYSLIQRQDNVRSLKDLLGFKGSTDARTIGTAQANGPRVKMGELAEKKIVSEAIVAVPFVEKGRRKFFFEIDRYFVDMARADRSPPGGVPDAGDSIQDMVEKMERYVFPPSMDFVTYPEITPFSMYIFEFSHEFSKLDLSNMWQNISPHSARSFDVATAKIRHDLNQNEAMGFALAKSDEAFMDQVQWMVFKVKQKGYASYDDKVAGKSLPKLSFKRVSPMQIMPKFSKFKIRRVMMQANSLKLKTSTITPSFRFGRTLTDEAEENKISFNWPYDYFSIIECAKISASIRFSKPDDVEEETQQGPQISGVSQLGPVVAQSAASKVKASTATRRGKKRKSVVGKSQKKVSVTKKSNVANKTVKGMKFSKVIKF